MSDLKCDWREVVARNPRGYLELNDGDWIIRGPVESVRVDEFDQVEIRLAWALKARRSPEGTPVGGWEPAPAHQFIMFENGSPGFAFAIERTPEGERVRFSYENFLYFTGTPRLGPPIARGTEL